MSYSQSFFILVCFFNSMWKYLYYLQFAYKGCNSSHEQHRAYYTQRIVDKELYDP